MLINFGIKSKMEIMFFLLRYSIVHLMVSNLDKAQLASIVKIFLEKIENISMLKLQKIIFLSIFPYYSEISAAHLGQTHMMKPFFE